MLQHDLLDAYTRQLPALRGLGPAMQAHLERELHRGGVHVHAVGHRVKSLPSLAGKLAHPGRTYHRLDEITDLVGIRVVTYFADEIESVAQMVERTLRVDWARSGDKSRGHAPTQFGYQSVHYVCAPPEEVVARRPEWDVAFEVQIRTILQHTWAEIEHDIGYKSPDAVPSRVRRRFSRLAGLLEIADDEFVALRREMEAYAASLRRPEILAEAGIGLDAESLRLLVASAPVEALDRALAAHLDCPLADTEFYPDYLLTALRAVGLDRPAQVAEAAEALVPTVGTLAAGYYRFADEALEFHRARIERVERGYGLLLLAHAQVLARNALDLHRVEQIRALYQRLDGLDATEALRVAQVFVRVFADARGP